MVKVKFYGMIRLNAGLAELELEAKTIGELIGLIDYKVEGLNEKDLKNCVILVNQINMLKLRKLKTTLKDGDEVLFLSPASGG